MWCIMFHDIIYCFLQCNNRLIWSWVYPLTTEINNQSQYIFTHPSSQFQSKFEFECANIVSTLRVVTQMEDRYVNWHWHRIDFNQRLKIGPCVRGNLVWCTGESNLHIHIYIPLTLNPRRGSRGISDISPRRPHLPNLFSYE
jgi:hypothetical protein